MKFGFIVLIFLPIFLSGCTSFPPQGQNNTNTTPFGQFDFTISLNPNTASVLVGNTSSSAVTLTLVNGSTQSINLSCSSLPTGATCSFSPTSCSPNCTSTLSISTSSTTPTGTFNIVVVGSSEGLNKSTFYQLTVQNETAQNNQTQNVFNISVNPNSGQVVQGNSTSAIVYMYLTSGSRSNVSLSCSGLPSNSSCEFFPLEFVPLYCYPTCSSQLTIETNSTVQPGTY